MSLIAELKALIVSTLDLPDVAPESVGDEQPLLSAELGIDSVDLLEIAVAVERRYGVVIDAGAGPEAFASVAALARYVAARQPAPAG